MDEQTTATIYKPPALVELGEFGEYTLGAVFEGFDSMDAEDIEI